MFEISLRIVEHCFAKVFLSSRRGRSLARGTNVSNFVRAFHILSPTKKVSRLMQIRMARSTTTNLSDGSVRNSTNLFMLWKHST